jgi:hypothetical protein
VSDITLDLSGVIALLLFLISAGVFGLVALISLILAVVMGSGKSKGLKGSKAFGFFIAAIPFVIINQIGFGGMFYTADSNSHNVNDILDKAACGWALIQPIIWIAAAVFFNRFRRR